MFLSKAAKVFNFRLISKPFYVSASRHDSHDCRFLVVGGGTAGCAMASKITHDFPNDKIIILEPNGLHYYQPLFTLIGAGIKNLNSSHRTMKSVLPKKAQWIKESAKSFNPQANEVVTEQGHKINYNYMVISTGLQLNYNTVPGLEEALKNENSGVCSIYSPKYVEKTWRCIQNLKGGDVIFTFPNSPVKCPGAPQKIMYLAEDFYRNNNRRDKVNISYNSSLGVIFGVKKYADALWKVVKERGINVNLRRNLIEVNSAKREATFQNLDKPDETFVVKYDVLHVTPPMGPMPALKGAASLVNEAGFVTVNKATMQHTKFDNIFALGDCADSPNSKTAAAVAAQSAVVQENLKSVILKKPLVASYGGYASCPLVTSYNKCILAEFDYDLKPFETFPINQAKERYSMFYMKKYAMPLLYWQLMTRGYWNGPQIMRKVFNPFKFD